MAVHRVRIGKDKANLVEALTMGKESRGTFETYADVMMFAAIYGGKHEKIVPLEQGISSDPAPISFEIFISRGYEWDIKLLAIALSEDTNLLSPYDWEAQAQQATLLEQAANGGLEQLEDQLRGAVDYSDRLLLLLNQERFGKGQAPSEFDLSRFL